MMMENKKRLMILGASYSQIPLYQAARKMGLWSIAASIPGPYDGFSYADEVCYVDISDPEAVLAKARELEIDGIATCSLDLGMAAIGRVCEKLHLPGPGQRAACLASNKWEMKKALAAAGVQTARYYKVSTREELEEVLTKLPFPVIIKAVDLMGGRGIYRSENPQEARANFEKSMKDTGKDYCLVEEFIQGEIFGVEAMVQNGELIYQLPNNIEAFYGQTPTPVGHSVPFKELETLGDQIEEQVGLAIRVLGLDNCPVNCDMIKRDGKVYVVELTGRSGATGLSEMVTTCYQLETQDTNYYEMIIRVAMGLEVKPYFDRVARKIPVLTHTLMSDRAGTVKAIHNENPPSENLLELSFNIVPGDEVRTYSNGRDRIGQVILKGDSLEQCEAYLEQILSRIYLELETK